MQLSDFEFNGKKLQEAREVRSITMTTLSETTGISRQSISQYEKGTQIPRFDVIEKFSNILNVPIEFFFKDSGDISLNTVYFRSLTSATNLERNRLKNRLTWVKEVIFLLKDYFEFISPNFPDFEINSNNFFNLNDSDIEHIAEETRKYWGIKTDPISNMVQLLENNGAIIVRGESESHSIDAFSEWSRVKHESPIIFLGNDKGSAVRSRFDVAHELGHLILHNNIDQNLFVPKNLSIFEKQANLFASSFLLPAESFSKTFYYPTLDSLLILKKKWNVSIGAIIKRSEQLNLIGEKTKTRLWMAYSRKGWRRVGEPLDDDILFEQPNFLKRCFQILVNKNILTKSEILTLLKLPVNDLEAICNLDYGFFEVDTDVKPKEPELKIFPINKNYNKEN